MTAPRSHPLAAWLLRASPALSRAVAYVAASLVVAPIVYHLARGSIAYLGLFEDDAFYYSIVADKVATLGKLTFDDTTLTNGFHPLWFSIVLLLRLLCGGLNGAYYGLLAAVFLASMVATYELSRLFARALGASAALAPPIALVHAVATDRVLSSGMETAVDVPFLLWLLLELTRDEAVTPRRAARLGLVSSLAILARLDVALLVPMFVVAWVILARPALRTVARSGAAFCAAGVAVPLYAASNWLFFGSIAPVSAMAKQLVKRPGVNVSYLHVIASYTQYGRAVGVELVLGALSVFLLWRHRAYERAGVRPAGLLAGGLALAFAALFYGLNSLSGWMYFGWYAYPLSAALVAALSLGGSVAAEWLAPEWKTRAGAAVVGLASVTAAVQAAGYFVAHGPRWEVEDNGLLAMSVELADAVRDRQGVFAMGAISGYATYMMKKPVVQLEGLVADRAMVEHIRREDDLGAVLRAYHVDYLVVSVHDARIDRGDGCYAVSEPDPEWAGHRIATMRGELCAEPVAHFSTRPPARRWSIFSGLDTYVFDLRGARWRSTPPG